MKNWGVVVTEYLIRMLRDHGARHIFIGLGALNDPFMSPLSTVDGVGTIVTAFEGGAAYMADGYARASGGIGLCLGIGGPGVLNMTTALAGAKTDRSSVIVISGEVPRSWAGMGGFQDATEAALDDLDVLRPVTGMSLSMSSRQVVPQHVRRAIVHVMSERTPAHLSVPRDVQQAELDAEPRRLPESLLHPRTLDEHALQELIAVLEDPDGQRIVVLAGPGVQQSGATDQLRAFAERFDVPVATTLSGKGTLPETHPLALGVFGYGGSRRAIDTIRSGNVDVLVVVGSGLSQRDTLQWDPAMLPSRTLVQIDSHPTLISRSWPVDLAVVSNPAEVFRRLSTLREAPVLAAGRGARTALLHHVSAGGDARYRTEDTRSEAIPMHPARVVAELRAAFPDDAALCVDSGAHRAWFAEYWDTRKPGTHFSLTNLGPMGGAVPLGIGAKLAQPHRPMLIATGDGCLLMHGMELHTASREQIPVVVAVMNNRSYGNIWFRASKISPRAERLTDIPGIDWVGFARSMGADGERVEQPAQIPAAVARGLAASRPYLLDLIIDKTYPTPVGVWRERQQQWEDND